MKAGSLRCIVCKIDEVGEEIVRDKCECGKEKQITCPYCPACVVARAIKRTEQAKQVARKVAKVCAGKAAAKPIEWRYCPCGSELLIKATEEHCSVCYALHFGLPQPTPDRYVILDRFGNRV